MTAIVSYCVETERTWRSYKRCPRLSPKRKLASFGTAYRVGMIGEWSHISAVGFSVDCFNIVELYVPLRLRRNFWKAELVFSLEAENNDNTAPNHNQTHNHKYIK